MNPIQTASTRSATRLACVLGVAGALVCAARTSWARDVYLNGIKLDSSVVVRNQKLDSCEVRFDENGNVFITAKGFQVKVAPAGAGTPDAGAPRAAATSASAAPTPASDSAARATLTRRYWLAAPQTSRGKVQYDIDVFVNGVFVKRIRSGDDKAIVEITRHVKVGQNRARIVATKTIGDRRISLSPTDVMEVILGEGSVGGGAVVIDRPLVTYRRNASEVDNHSDEFTFEGR